jgi:MFS transporter, putative metabolite:H+ symporter
MIVWSAGAIIICGLIFSQAANPVSLILMGVTLTLANNIMSFSFHAYQTELFPTGIRARAVGFVYSWSRLSAIFTSFIIAALLRQFGVTGVFLFIALAMLIVMAAVEFMGPRTRDLSLEQISQ